MGKYIEWETFRDAAVDILQNDPFTSRLIVKYNHKRGVCLLKVTDDKKWIKTKITNIKDFTKIEQFVNAASKILANQFEDNTAMEEEKTPLSAELPKKQHKSLPDGSFKSKKTSKKN